MGSLWQTWNPPAAGKARTKNMVLRLDPDLADLLATVAEVEGRSVSDVAREAIAALIQARRKDKRFRRLLEDNLARHQRLLDLLQDEPAVTALDAADLVVIAGRTLGIGTDAALAQMDIAAAQDALAEARSPGQESDAAFPDRASAAAAGVGLVHALLRHRPFPAAKSAGRGRGRAAVPLAQRVAGRPEPGRRPPRWS